jgi:hypothetical protein
LLHPNIHEKPSQDARLSSKDQQAPPLPHHKPLTIEFRVSIVQLESRTIQMLRGLLTEINLIIPKMAMEAL